LSNVERQSNLQPMRFAYALVCFLYLFSVGIPLAQTRPEALPAGVIREVYDYQLQRPANGTPPWRWRLLRGTLPPGIALEPSGLLAGAPTVPGEFHFTVEASDSSPKPVVQARDYVIRVPSALAVVWTKEPGLTAEGGIAGELQVTNGTGRTVDLTVIVVAVSTMNKAFALGYERVSAGPGSTRVSFGSTLPRDSYVVHADAVAEIADTYEIYRARLQTAPLKIQ
jgi:Putative Ig domain